MPFNSSRKRRGKDHVGITVAMMDNSWPPVLSVERSNPTSPACLVPLMPSCCCQATAAAPTWMWPATQPDRGPLGGSRGPRQRGIRPPTTTAPVLLTTLSRAADQTGAQGTRTTPVEPNGRLCVRSGAGTERTRRGREPRGGQRMTVAADRAPTAGRQCDQSHSLWAGRGGV